MSLSSSAPVGAIAFKVLAEIAVGSTARIDLCRATGSGRPDLEGRLLAVKRLHPHIADDPGFANEFFDEAWMTAALKHPNVVEVAGWGRDVEGAYLAVELVEGVSLSRLMKTVFDTGEAFGERMVVFLGARICHGLAAAHSLRGPDGELVNLVHRDLTPANVLVGFNGDVKVADFGLAKAKLRVTKTLTGIRKGAPTYMAPEQASGDAIDARADVFSLGVVLFELFAGRRPWAAQTDLEMVQITTREPPADLRELRPKIDRELVAVVNMCLKPAPEDRFQSAREVGRRLDEWLTLHGYQEGNEDALARFVRRNGMRQMRWFERAIAGELLPKPRIGRALAASVPSVPRYGAATNRPAAAEPSSEPATFADMTEVSEVAWHLIAKTPSVSAFAPAPKSSEGGEVDWGEEVPTLVKRDSSAIENLRAQRAMSTATRAPVIADEDTHRRVPESAGPRSVTPTDPQRLIHRPEAPPLLGVEAIGAEADRLAREAARRQDDAKIAALAAQRKSDLAQLATEAALAAADAVRLAATAGLAAASRRLEDARQLERAMLRGQSDPLGLTPAPTIDDRPAPFLTPSALVAASGVSSIPPASSSAPRLLSSPHPSPLPPSYTPRPVFAPAAAPAALAPRPAPVALSTADLDSFRDRLAPKIAGIPVPIFATLVGGAVAAVALVVWFVFE